MSPTGTPITNSKRRTVPREREARNTRHAFHETRRLYVQLADRARENRIFLPRNLLRRGKRTDRNAKVPDVMYQSGEPDVPYKAAVRNLRCLWCMSKFFKFRDPEELLHHLVTCHGMLRYTMVKEPGDKPQRNLIIKIALLRDEQPVPKGEREESSSRVFTFEATLVNNRSCGKRLVGPSSADDLPDAKRRRTLNMRRSDRHRTSTRAMEARPAEARPSTRANIKKTDEIAVISDDGNPSQATVVKTESKANVAVTKRKTAGKPRGKRETGGKPSFKSAREAARQERLFHSVVSNSVIPDHVDLDDSDLEVGDEQEWRYRIRCDEIVEFTDTIPVEHLFMNLWNQFVGMEFRIDADRGVAAACRAFLEKYHKILNRMKLRVSYLRHLTEMHRIGLIDSEDLFNGMNRARELNDSHDNSAEPRFRYAEDLVEQQERKVLRQNGRDFVRGPW